MILPGHFVRFIVNPRTSKPRWELQITLMLQNDNVDSCAFGPSTDFVQHNSEYNLYYREEVRMCSKISVPRGTRTQLAPPDARSSIDWNVRNVKETRAIRTTCKSPDNRVLALFIRPSDVYSRTSDLVLQPSCSSNSLAWCSLCPTEVIDNHFGALSFSSNGCVMTVENWLRCSRWYSVPRNAYRDITQV